MSEGGDAVRAGSEDDGGNEGGEDARVEIRGSKSEGRNPRVEIRGRNSRVEIRGSNFEGQTSRVGEDARTME